MEDAYFQFELWPVCKAYIGDIIPRDSRIIAVGTDIIDGYGKVYLLYCKG